MKVSSETLGCQGKGSGKTPYKKDGNKIVPSYSEYAFAGPKGQLKNGLS